jgi:hypothetical protein
VERTDLRAPGATVEGLTLVEVAVTVTTADGRSQTLRTRRLEGRR